MAQTEAFTLAQVAALLDVARANVTANLAKGMDLAKARDVAQYDLQIVMGINRDPAHTPAQAAETLHKRFALRRILNEIGA